MVGVLRNDASVRFGGADADASTSTGLEANCSRGMLSSTGGGCDSEIIASLLRFLHAETLEPVSALPAVLIVKPPGENSISSI